MTFGSADDVKFHVIVFDDQLCKSCLNLIANVVWLPWIEHTALFRCQFFF